MRERTSVSNSSKERIISRLKIDKLKELCEPPKGEGYQLWNTTSEGSPISPVFETLDKLCEWCEVNATTFGKFKATKEEWKEMLQDGFVYHKEGNVIMF